MSFLNEADWRWWRWCVPVAPCAVRVKADHTNAIWTVFSHQTVWVWAMREVLRHQRHCDRHLFYPFNWPLKLFRKTGKGYYAIEDCLHNDVIFWSKLPYMETELFKVENLCSVYLLCGTSLLHTTRWSNTSHRGTFFFFVPQRSTEQHHSLKPKQGQPPLGLG